MERVELKVSSRNIGKTESKRLRKDGLIPAVLYGLKRETKPLVVNSKEFDGVIGTEAGWNVLIDLSVEGGEKVLTRIADYQADVIRRYITHVDFQVLDISKKMKIAVPLKFVGKAEGVKKGGILEIITRNLEVRCFPTNIPEHIDVDVSALDVGHSIHVKELVMPEGVECIFDNNFSIATISAPTEELTAELPVAEGAVEGAVPVEGAAPVEGAVPAEGAAPAEGGAPQKGAAPAEAQKGKKKE